MSPAASVSPREVKAATLALVFLLVGCEVNKPTKVTDQCLRVELFQRCLQLIPAGPTSTQYNDWAEVVDECASAAMWQSLRPVEAVKKGCGI